MQFTGMTVLKVGNRLISEEIAFGGGVIALKLGRIPQG
jgi:hypothetical protein